MNCYSTFIAISNSLNAIFDYLLYFKTFIYRAWQTFHFTESFLVSVFFRYVGVRGSMKFPDMVAMDVVVEPAHKGE